MTTEDSSLPFDTREMSAADALVEIDELCWSGPPQGGADLFRALHAQERDHPTKARKTVLDAIEERYAEFDLLVVGEPATEEGDTSDDGNGDAMVSEGGPDPIDAMTDEEVERQPDESVAEHVDRMAEAQGVEPIRFPEPVGSSGFTTLDEGGAVVPATVDEDAQVVEATPEPAPVEVPPAVDGSPAMSADVEGEPTVSGPVPPEPGAVVIVTDIVGGIHEGIIVRAVEPDEMPLIVSIKDGTDSQVRLIHDPYGLEPLSWRAP